MYTYVCHKGDVEEELCIVGYLLQDIGAGRGGIVRESCAVGGRAGEGVFLGGFV